MDSAISYVSRYRQPRPWLEGSRGAIPSRGAAPGRALKWNATQEKAKEPDLYTLDNIAINLARLEENEHDYRRSIKFLELAVHASPNPAALKQQIAQLQQKLAAGK